jgi:hypothetical protein
MRFEKYLTERISHNPADNTLMKRFGKDMDNVAGASREQLYGEIAAADASSQDPFSLNGADVEAFMKWQKGDKTWNKGLK